MGLGLLFVGQVLKMIKCKRKYRKMLAYMKQNGYLCTIENKKHKLIKHTVMNYKEKTINAAEVVNVINESIFNDRLSERNQGASLAHVSIAWNGNEPNDYLGKEITISLLYYAFGAGGHFTNSIHTGLFVENFGDTVLVDKLNSLINTCK